MYDKDKILNVCLRIKFFCLVFLRRNVLLLSIYRIMVLQECTSFCVNLKIKAVQGLSVSSIFSSNLLWYPVYLKAEIVYWFNILQGKEKVLNGCVLRTETNTNFSELPYISFKFLQFTISSEIKILPKMCIIFSKICIYIKIRSLLVINVITC